MRVRIRFPLRHPLYPDWPITPVRDARRRSVAISGAYRELVDATCHGITVERAIFVMHTPDTPFLSESDRDVLWENFRVPVFACLLDGDGRLVGYECEAQDGLHVAPVCPDDSRRMMISGEDSVLGYRIPLAHAVLENSACDCGRPGQRLRFTGALPPARPHTDHYGIRLLCSCG